MKVKNLLDITSDRYTYNRVRKMYLEQKGDIHCSYCQYHCNENRTKKWYGWYDWGGNNRITFPNWKLVSKNRKQWMNKTRYYKTVYYQGVFTGGGYYEIYF